MIENTPSVELQGLRTRRDELERRREDLADSMRMLQAGRERLAVEVTEGTATPDMMDRLEAEIVRAANARGDVEEEYADVIAALTAIDGAGEAERQAAIAPEVAP